MRRSLLAACCLFMACLYSAAQPTWGFRGGVGVDKKISKGMSAGLEARYHQTDDFQRTDRWSLGVSLSKRLYRNEAKTFSVKSAVGYKFMKVYNDWSTKYKGDLAIAVNNDLDPQYYIDNNYDFNLNNSYVETRHRVTASVQAAAEFGRFKISLRESYQFTHRDSADFVKDKYRYEDNSWTVKSSPDGKSPSNSNVLRSKVNMDYDIPHWKLDPFVSYEMFNGIDDSFKIEKSRITAGVEFSINKKHNFEVAYLWQNQHDDDEPAGSFICFDYTLEF